MKFCKNLNGLKLKQKNGFTLIEMVITVAIIAVLTGLTAVGLYGYLSSAYTTKVNETAKTVFYAAQNYLLEQKQLGQLESFNKQLDTYGGNITWDQLKLILKENQSDIDLTDYANKYSTDSAAYMMMQKGSDAANPLYQIVKEVTNDESLLDNTFLLEYDKRTGVVRSVFYSEKTDSFAYDGNRDSTRNVILRQADQLKSKKQGYYGVDTTGRKKVSEIYVKSPEKVVLYNGERLYLEWTDTNVDNPEFQMDMDLLNHLLYDVTVYRRGADGTTTESVMTIKDISVADKTKNITMDKADDALTAANGYRVAFQKNADATTTYQLLLDDIHHSLFTAYRKGMAVPPNVEIYEDIRAEDILVCEVVAKLNKVDTEMEAESFASISNLESSAFGGGEKNVVLDGSTVDAGGSGTLEDGVIAQPFSVKYNRHLENIRYGQNIADNAHFKQIANINWVTAEGRNQTNKFVPITYTDPFRGSYESALRSSGGYFELSNLSIQQNEGEFIGMFAQNMGKITGLTLKNPSVTGSMYVGTVTGVNGGLLEHVTVTGATVRGSHLLGGITGYNTAAGKLDEVSAEVSVLGETLLYERKTIADLGNFAKDSKGSFVGGIVGLNKGTGNNLTAGKLKVTSVSGTSYVGGVFGSNDSADGINISDVTNYSQIKLSANAASSDSMLCIGGIAGYQGAGNLKKGNNYGLIKLTPINGVTGNQIQHIGGIVGENTGNVEECSNEAGSSELTAAQNECIEEIKKGRLPDYMGKNVGGIVGTNQPEGKVKNCLNKDAVTLGYQVVGGLVGNNLGKVEQNSAGSTVSGLVVATDYLAGGIFGYHAGGKVDNYTNQADVIGKGMIGGIMGFHGNVAEDGAQKVVTYLNTLKNPDSPEYYDSLLAIGERLTAGSDKEIESCNNNGFIYARDFFSGGITGANYGKINKSNSIKGDKGTFQAIYSLGNADCVGGIAGFNGSSGSINGTIIQKQSVKAELVADDFVGGVVGFNKGNVKGYQSVTGVIHGKGDCVGGVIGLNTNEAAVSELTVNETTELSGAYFVGGIMGCNVALAEVDNTTLKGVHSGSGKITGEAYIGGILGYNAWIASGVTNIGSLFSATGELKLLKDNAFSGEPPTGSLDLKKTVFQNCVSKANVQAKRYVGGIVGYNSARSPLWIAGCSNEGRVSIIGGSSVSPSPDGNKYYYIGGITGRNSQAGIIHKSNNNGTVESPSTYLGGICEVNEGYVQFCTTGVTASGVVGTTNSVGGIVGLNSGTGNVVSCSADQYAKISGGNKTGGLVGTNALKGVITSNLNGTEAKDVSEIGETSQVGQATMSYCNAEIVGRDDTGGIVGYNKGRIKAIEVRKTAKITGLTNVGGFVGYNASGGNIDILEGLTNYGNVYGNHEVGGIVGKHDGTGINKCTNSGTVEAKGDTKGYAGGITGSVASTSYITNCTNYGIVKSNLSFAGGISGINNGRLEQNNNFGSVEGSIVAKGVVTVGDQATGSAIGGVTGCNLPSGNVFDCASRDNKSDSDRDNNPFYKAGEINKIKGVYMVGGIIGCYARNQISDGDFVNKSDYSREVSITIEGLDSAPVIKGTRCYIGGVLGFYNGNPKPQTLDGYTYSGKISISDKAGGTQHCIGGIIGEQHANITLKNCMFSGIIEGKGNNPDNNDYAGIGGLAGQANGPVIVSEAGGVYTSNTKGSAVAGAKRVGGVAGVTTGKFQIKLMVDGKEVPLEEVNQDRSTDTYLYYVNRATVKGGKSVGGFYGSANAEQKSLKNLRNEGQILPVNVNGNTNLGGIAGNTDAALMSDCQNSGQIGENKNVIITSNVGGLVGSWTNGGNKTIENCRNESDIYAGLTAIGGLIGNLSKASLSPDNINNGNIITNSAKSGSVVKGVGGIVGYASEVKIVNTSDTQASMSSPESDIRLIGKTENIGGVVGYGAGTVEITNIKNERKITAIENSNKDLNVSAGGIVGCSNTKTVISKCTNAAIMNLGDGNSVGGITGYITGGKANFNIADCVNTGSITGSDSVGGITGYLKDITNAENSFINNRNSGAITGRAGVGGLSGYVVGLAGKFRDSANTGKVTGQKGLSKGVSIDRIGGCIGAAKSTAASGLSFNGIRNEGMVLVNAKAGINNISHIGGIFGAFEGNQTWVNNSSNTGGISIESQSGLSLKIEKIAGIAGSVSEQARVGISDSIKQRTFNSGTVEVKSDANSSQIGGIAGYLGYNSKLQACENRGKVIGNSLKSVDVGGVAGKAEGLVLSCRTAEGADVTGYGNVGGLVGCALNYTCKITSYGTGIPGEGGFDLSVSNSLVEGSERVGGIVGYQQEATIYNVYASEKAAVKLLKTGTNQNAAGGIVGYAGRAEAGVNQKGIIAGCFSFAEVKGNNPEDEQPFIGGVIGYRERTGTTAYTSITNCYSVDSTKVSETQPPANQAGTVTKAAWAVGNEPLVNHAGVDTIYSDSRDFQEAIDKEPLKTGEKFFWSEDSYNGMCGTLGIKDEEKGPYTDVASILNVMQHYDGFKLEAPELTTIKVDEEYNYSFPFLPIAGFYTEYGLHFYVDGKNINTIVPDDEKKLIANVVKQPIQIGEKFDTHKLNLKSVFKNAGLRIEDYVGKTISIGTYAKGYTLNDIGENLPYTKDSDIVIRQQFVIMPPLPTPWLKAIPPAPENTDWFDTDGKQIIAKLEITNWAEYEKAAAAVYPELNNIDTGKLAELDLYQQFINGVIQFEMKDNFNSANIPIISNVKSVHHIKEKSLDPNASAFYEVIEDPNTGKNKAYITINYKDDNNFILNWMRLPWHAFTVQAMISEAQKAITVDPLDNDFRYRYTESLESMMGTYRLCSRFQQPIRLEGIYTGLLEPGVDSNTPGYSLQWQQKNEGEEQYIKEYKVELTYLKKTEAGQTSKFDFTGEMYQKPPFTTLCTKKNMPLSAEQLNEVLIAAGVDLTIPWWEHEADYELGFRVTVHSNDSAVYIDSLPSDTKEFKLIKRQKKVRDISVARIENTLRIDWADDYYDAANPAANQYDVTYEISSNGISYATAAKAVSQDLFLEGITIPTELLDKPMKVSMKIVKKGVQDLSLNSLEEQKEQLIGERLEKPINLTVSAVKTANDDVGVPSIFFRLAWLNTGAIEGNEVITEDNCSGYEIEAVMTKAGLEQPPVRLSVTGYDMLTADMILPYEDVSQIKFNIRAVGIYPAAESSDWASTIQTITGTKLNAPILEGVTRSDTEIYPTSGSPVLLTREEYKKEAEYKLKINVNETGGIGQQIRVLQGEAVLWETETTETTGTVSVSISGDLGGIEKAGQEFTVQMSNMTGNVTQALPSGVSETKFMMPRIRLDQPGEIALSVKEVIEELTPPEPLDPPEPPDPLAPTEIRYDVYTAEVPIYSTLTESQEKDEEKVNRKSQYFQIQQKDGDGWKAASFIPLTLDEDGNPKPIGDGKGVTEYELTEENQNSVTLHFKMVTPIPEADRSNYRILVKNLAKTDSSNTKYGDSNDTERSLDPDATTTFMLKNKEEEELLVPETEEETTEEGTTEEETSEEGTTEEGTTEEGKTEESTTGEEKTEEGKTEESKSEESKSEESKSEESKTEERKSKESTSDKAVVPEHSQ